MKRFGPTQLVLAYDWMTERWQLRFAEDGGSVIKRWANKARAMHEFRFFLHGKFTTVRITKRNGVGIIQAVCYS